MPDRLTDTQREAMEKAWTVFLDEAQPLLHVPLPAPGELKALFEAGFLAALPREDEGLREALAVMRRAFQMAVDIAVDAEGASPRPRMEAELLAAAASPVASREVGECEDTRITGHDTHEWVPPAPSRESE